MPSVKDLIKENLIRLRKEHKLTQLELSQRINYSDKAISRWETGEVTPDVETLEALASLYEIPISHFFETPTKALSRKEKKELKSKKRSDAPHFAPSAFTRWLSLFILSLLILWSAAVCFFFILLRFTDRTAWLAFIWTLPLCFLLCLFFFTRPYRRIMQIVFSSLLLWSLILSVYLQFLSWNLFPLFIVGAPVQALILLLPFLRVSENATEDGEESAPKNEAD